MHSSVLNSHGIRPRPQGEQVHIHARLGTGIAATSVKWHVEAAAAFRVSDSPAS